MDPYQAQLVTSDIPHFWIAFDNAAQAAGEDRVKIFEEEYFAKGSIGLQDFIQARIQSAAALVETLERYPHYYRSIRANTLRVAMLESPIRQSFIKLQALYPEAVFPDVYFVIGCMNSGGTISEHGLLIGTEISARAPDSPLDELDAYFHQALKPVDEIPVMVAHELIHVQQHYAETKPMLLKHALLEGSADFIGELIAGRHINHHLYTYGYAHERVLWEEFRQAMDGPDCSQWLYNGLQAKERPGDLGYFMGYQICSAYYNRAPDKQQAIRAMLNIQDVQQFLQASHYAAQF